MAAIAKGTIMIKAALSVLVLAVILAALAFGTLIAIAAIITKVLFWIAVNRRAAFRSRLHHLPQGHVRGADPRCVPLGA